MFQSRTLALCFCYCGSFDRKTYHNCTSIVKNIKKSDSYMTVLQLCKSFYLLNVTVDSLTNNACWQVYIFSLKFLWHKMSKQNPTGRCQKFLYLIWSYVLVSCFFVLLDFGEPYLPILNNLMKQGEKEMDMTRNKGPRLEYNRVHCSFVVFTLTIWLSGCPGFTGFTEYAVFFPHKKCSKK